MVAIRKDVDVLKEKFPEGLPMPVHWEDSRTAQELQRLDHLYTVHYPDPENTGKHRRYFGGDVIQGTQGSCSTPGVTVYGIAVWTHTSTCCRILDLVCM